eukprot:scaffold9981_cov51-Attheya_sp.AAC.2
MVSTTHKKGLCYDYNTLDHDYVLRHSSFLPDPAMGYARCLDPVAPGFRKRLMRLQAWYEKDCPNAQHERLVLKLPLHGFGSVVNSWIKPFMFALESGILFWSPQFTNLHHTQTDTTTGEISINSTVAPLCHLNSSQCWFKPMSKCEEEKHGGDRPPQEFDGVPKRLSDWDDMNVYSHLLRGDDKYGYPLHIPAQHRSNGHFWYYNQLLSYLMRPNDQLIKIINEAKDQLEGWKDLERPLLSLHVRHGDSCPKDETVRKARQCEPLEKYMSDAVLPMAEKYGVKSIFLSTDNEMVIQDTKNYPQFNWLFQPEVLRGSIPWDDKSVTQTVDTYLVINQVLTDLFLLAEGDLFVGKFTSNIARLAFSLMAIRLRGVAPYISLDSTWCFDWGQPAGNSTLGTFKC